jgi:hypothetical protein
MTKKSITEIIREQHAIQKERGGRWDEKGWAERVINGSALWEYQKDDPEYWEALQEGIQRRQQDPEYIEANKRGNKKMAETQRKRYEDPAERQKLSDLAKQAWKQPGYRENAIQKLRERFADVNDHPRYKGPIIGIHTDTGHYIVIRGTRDYKLYGIRRGTVEDAIKANKPGVNFYWSRVTEEYVAEYAMTGAKQITDIEPYVREHTIVATHAETGEVLEFARMRDVVEAGYHRGHVWSRMNTSNPYRGYLWVTKPYEFDK